MATVKKLLPALLLLGCAGNAYAYLDPGTGSAILQGILGALAALLVTLKLYWHRLLRFFGLGRKPAEPTESDQNQKSETAAQEEESDRLG